MTADAWIVVIQAQFLGVSLALVAFYFLSRASETHLNLGIVIPFGLAYLLFAIALYWHFDGDGGSGRGWLMSWFSKRGFTLSFLYGDAIFLAVMVFFSGGVGGGAQSVFTPIFLSVPSVGSILVPLTGYPSINVWGIAIFIIVGYGITYYYSYEKINIINKKMHGRTVVGVLCLSILLTVLMGRVVS